MQRTFKPRDLYIYEHIWNLSALPQSGVFANGKKSTYAGIHNSLDNKIMMHHGGGSSRFLNLVLPCYELTVSRRTCSQGDGVAWQHVSGTKTREALSSLSSPFLWGGQRNGACGCLSPECILRSTVDVPGTLPELISLEVCGGRMPEQTCRPLTHTQADRHTHTASTIQLA